MERRFATLEVRQDRAGPSAGSISGYASVFYDGTEGTEFRLWDNTFERIEPTAFDEALQSDEDVLALFNHDPNMLLGKRSSGTLSLEVDKRGLRYSVSPGETTLAKDLRVHLDRGDISGSSFGFIPVKERWSEDGKKSIRHIESVRLVDVGPVVAPAYSGTSANARSVYVPDEVKHRQEAWRDALRSANREAKMKRVEEIMLREAQAEFKIRVRSRDGRK